MPYELVELSTGNMTGFYDTEYASFRDVLESIQQHGEQSVATLALGYDETDGDGRVIATGKALVQLALHQVPHATTNGPVDRGKNVLSRK